MKTSKLGIEQLNDRVVLTAGIGGLVNEAPEPTPVVFTGGWGMAQYQYGFEGTYHNSAETDPAKDLKGDEGEPTPIIFIGGYGAASYQYANETTYDPSSTGDPTKDFTSEETEAKDIVFVGGWGSSMYQYG